MSLDKGREAWETNAVFWDDYMGDESNYFHCDMVRPSTEKLLDVKFGDFILDIACGSGNFSAYLAKRGVRVVAFDYSEKMIELAKKRRHDVLDYVSFNVCDATEYEELMSLKCERLFDKAVANMAIMDIARIEPLFKAVYEMLVDGGSFVFATHHPAFTFERGDYFTSCINKGDAIEGQPRKQNYYHRSMQDILNVGFKAGFVCDGFYEVPFPNETVPIIMIVRMKK